jgi:FkbM family methyltransferase
MRHRSGRRFDRLELGLLIVLAAALGAVAERWHLDPAGDAGLRAKYGRSHWSHGPEEWVIRDYFQDRRGGIFLDVGSADARVGSNTYFLEAQLGWSGVAIDAQAEYAAGYKEHRPNTQFFSLFVSDRSEDDATLYVAARHRGASSVRRDFAVAYGGEDVVARQVPTITLNDLLSEAGVSRIDFMSMDIELSEPQALAGLDLNRYRPSLVCIEAHAELGQWLLDYFAAQSYALVDKYIHVHNENFFFAPIKTPRH